jgi:hypothetical protein
MASILQEAASLLEDIVGVATVATPTSSSTTAITPSTSSVTAAVSVLKAVVNVMENGVGDLSADTTLANNVMSILETIDPAAIPVITAIEGMEWLLPVLVGWMKNVSANSSAPTTNPDNLGSPDRPVGR